MRVLLWLTIASLLAGCTTSNPPEPAPPVPAPTPAPMPPTMVLEECMLVAAVFAMPMDTAEGMLHSGFEPAPHPLAADAAAFAVVTNDCVKATGTAWDEPPTNDAQSFGLLEVTPPEQWAGDVDMYLWPTQIVVDQQASLAAWDSLGFGRHLELAPIATNMALADTSRAGTVSVGDDRIGFALRQISDGPAEVHRIYAEDGTSVTGYVDVSLPENRRWSGSANVASTDQPDATTVLLHQPGFAEARFYAGPFDYTFHDAR